MSYPDAAWERAMTVQEVMLKGLSGKLHWFRAADILGWSPRTLRRWRERYETHGYVGPADSRSDKNAADDKPGGGPAHGGHPDGAIHRPRALGVSHALGQRPGPTRPSSRKSAGPWRGWIEHISAYSPQARGRSERPNRTFQDRLVNELRVAKVTTLTAANAYLRDRFIPDYNATFSCAPADPASAFVPLGRVDLEQILCHQE